MSDVTADLLRWGGHKRPYGEISDTCNYALATVIALRADAAAGWDKCEERRLQVVELAEALKPFAWLADNAYPPAVDFMFGAGYFDHFEKAKAALAKVAGA